MKRTIILLLLLSMLLGSLLACSPEPSVPHQHAYAHWVTTTPATCEGDGVETSTCTCGETKTRPIAGGHEYVLQEVDVSENPATKNGGTFYCDRCKTTTVKEIKPADIGMPVVSINGSLEGISKENKVNVSFTYDSEDQTFTCEATLKVQGATSAEYPKKNFNVQFFEEDGSKKKVELADGWGKESKYCMKANWTDFSQARNVVSAKLYGDVARSLNKTDDFSKLFNGGAIDGFPIAVFHNGAFLGLYTMNMPKDKWIYDMDDGGDVRHAALMADQWCDSVSLRQHVAYDFVSTNWDLEHCSTEDEEIGTAWCVDSFNRMMDFVIYNNGDQFKQGLPTYINVERTIDVLIFTWVMCGIDNTSKNIIWLTYDGTVWAPCVYDMDSTWGMWWDASHLNTAGEVKSWSNSSVNLLFRKMRLYYADEIFERYAALREGPLSDRNIRNKFTDFFESIPDVLYAADEARWADRPGMWMNHETQLLSFAEEHLNILDDKFIKGTW